MAQKAQVVVAPVPAEIIQSALEMPDRSECVAFGTLKDIQHFAVGLPVYIYVSSSGPHPLHIGGRCAYGGRLGAIVPAVQSGMREGKHPNPVVRPPFAESDDTPAMMFWEVLGFTKLATPIPFSRFKSATGGSPFVGGAPRWPTLAMLAD